MSRPKRVLFVTYGGGHVGMVLPVIRALEVEGAAVECELLALTTGLSRARAARPASGYADWLHLVDRQRALAWGARLAPGNTSPDVPIEETHAYLGVNYLELIARHGEDGAAEIWRSQGRLGFKPMGFMSRLIEAVGCDAVVATNSPRSEQAALEGARSMGLPTVGMVDLFGLDSDTFVLRAERPDYTCVISGPVRRRLLERGFPADGVVVTGNPAFDSLFAAESRVAAKRFVADKGWQGLSTILFAGHVEPYTHPATSVPAGHALPIQIAAVLREHVESQADRALILRFHPSDWHTYPRPPAASRVHFSEPPVEPLHPLVLASSVVIVQTSTVGLESAVAGKPVISVESSPASHIWFSLAALGVSTPCPTPVELPGAIDRVLAGEGRTADPSYCSDGRAADRVAAVVRRALEGASAAATPAS